MKNTVIFSPEGATWNLHLKSNELEVITNPSLKMDFDEVDLPKVIYGRMLSGKSVNKIEFKKMFESLWQNKAGTEIDDYAEGIVILTFESEALKNRIIKG